MLECSPAPTTVTTPPSLKTENVRSKKSPSSIELQPWCGQHLTDQESVPLKNVYNYAEIDEAKPKTPMCRVAELARYNKLKHEYKLMDESGPAHRKLFRVSLILTPDQVFDGCGASIKKAQQAAAEAALRETLLPRPPARNPKKSDKKDPRNPLFLVNCIAQKMGLELNFCDVTSVGVPPPLMTPSNGRLPVPVCGNLIPFPNNRFGVPSQVLLPCPSGPRGLPVYLMSRPVTPRPAFPYPFFPRLFQVQLTLGRSSPAFIGVGPDRVKAKRHAALQALNFLTSKLSSMEKDKQSAKPDNNVSGPTNKTDATENDDSARNSADDDQLCTLTIATTSTGKPKSAISQIHECALHMRMNVEFEIISEDGPPHNRHYVYQCRLISSGQVIVADGEGGSKKLAKQNACAVMLTKLKASENSPIFIASTILKSQKKTSTQKESKRKTIVKDMKMNPDYGHQINPVSRLMQVMQARKEPEPRFQLIMEHGQNRYKEFVVEVTCMDGLRCKGTGPNKKLAKRAAAEAMLAAIGYVKPMPKPGKSLLKKRNENQFSSNDEATANIGVFNPNDCVQSAPSADSETSMKNIGVWNAETNDSTTVSQNSAISEITLSVTASIGSQVMTFADVDRSVKTEDQGNIWGKTVADLKNENNVSAKKCENATARATPPPATSTKRVTFSNEVSACPPPDDSSYPAPSITPLKSDVVFVSKMRRRSRDAKKKLTDEQRRIVANMAREFLANCKDSHKYAVFSSPSDFSSSGNFLISSGDLSSDINQLSISESRDLWPSYETNEQSKVETARQRLERIAETVRFSIGFSDFPKVEDDSDLKYFSLVSLGIEKPLVCHGCGNSEDAAHDNAAYNVLLALSNYDLMQPSEESA
ncbi:unnamed protein product [Enterobius vermicularis]|uniref:DRBM domain-containing protein n=1 Tax=Enterobius vermicularis TaxID=51028 RepID=A0A0N4UZ68_ENTVE|nr:unnamed protein product [Enterobius vermicularis]